MKLFAISLLLFTSVLVLGNQLPNLFLDPYYGNVNYSIKHDHFSAHSSEFNSVVFGSSRSYRHIDPQVLDQSLPQYGLSTFNFSAPATSNPEIYFLYEAFLNEVEKGDVEFAFVELNRLRKPARGNLNTTQNYYWYNPDYWLFAIDYTLSSDYSLRRKTELLFAHTVSLLYRVLNLHSVVSLYHKDEGKHPVYLGDDKDGHYTLDAHVAASGASPGLQKRRRELFEQPSVLQNRAATASRAFSSSAASAAVNPVHLGKLLELIEKSQAKGIQVTFVIPPRLGNYRELVALKAHLPPGYLIEVADPKRFPELYTTEYSFDVGHLNARGAALFSHYFAAEVDLALTARGVKSRMAAMR